MRIPAFVAALLFASAGIGAACSGSETSAGEDDDDDDRRADDSTAGPASKKKDAGGGEAASPIASCGATQPLPLWVSEDDGFPTRLHVPVEVDGKSGSFVFDMGSETTFVATPTGTPDPVADGGTVAVEGCATAYMGRPYTAERAVEQRAKPRAHDLRDSDRRQPQGAGVEVELGGQGAGIIRRLPHTERGRLNPGARPGV